MNGNATQQIVNKAWSFAHVLRDDGLSYMAYTEQITFLLFLKMADPGERYSMVLTNPPFGKKSSISIVNEEGDLEKEDASPTASP